MEGDKPTREVSMNATYPTTLTELADAIIAAATQLRVHVDRPDSRNALNEDIRAIRRALNILEETLHDPEHAEESDAC
jgi:hypothetical protein